jgi:putative chitinase
VDLKTEICNRGSNRIIENKNQQEIMDTLAKGAKGDAVKRLQQKLGGVVVDGDFGGKTETALIAWQKANGVTPADGVARLATFVKLGLVTGAAASLNLKALLGVIPDAVIEEIINEADRFGITSNLRLAHFLSQCAVESGNFKTVSENLNYSAKRLLQIFPKKFTEAEAAAYGGKPEKIGNRVYANIIGNGDEASGDGYRYRGRGYIQLTGKSNYQAFAKVIGEDVVANPDSVASKFPLASAAHYFKNRSGMWATCDKGTDDATIKAVTLKVNSAALGLEERKTYFKKYWPLLSGS